MSRRITIAVDMNDQSILEGALTAMGVDFESNGSSIIAKTWEGQELAKYGVPMKFDLVSGQAQHDEDSHQAVKLLSEIRQVYALTLQKDKLILNGHQVYNEFVATGQENLPGVEAGDIVLEVEF